MRFFNLARPGGKPVEENDAGGQLFLRANFSGYTPPPNMKGSGTASTPKVAPFGKPTGGNVKKP